MNKLSQFCFRAKPSQRGVWCIISICFAFLSIFAAYLFVEQHRYFLALVNMAVALLNAMFALVSSLIYRDWRRNNPKPDFYIDGRPHWHLGNHLGGKCGCGAHVGNDNFKSNQSNGNT